MQFKVSLIIPHNDSIENLNILCEKIPLWTKYPDEILIIDSSKTKIILNKNFTKFCDNKNIVLRLIYSEYLYPGHARNKGILKAMNPILAFLDVNTWPTNEWLSSGLKLLEMNKIQGVWGSTQYIIQNHQQEIIRAATFGSEPLRTLPGSIFHKEVFNTCGLFIESVRAGEDADLISRMNIHQIIMEETKEIVSYVGLTKATYVSIIQKWYRNYLSAAKLTYIKPHKDWYFYALSLVAIIIAFNWNWLVSEKEILSYSGSLFYIPHITKISIISLISLYVILRGLLLPIRKGINWYFLLPMNFIKVACFSLLLDIIKIFAFAKAKLN